MKVSMKNKLPDGTKIQVEDWSKDYNFLNKNDMLVVYPIAKISGDNQFSPRQGETFRLELEFDDEKQVMTAYNELMNGNKQIADYKEHGIRYYRDFI
ncbi:hypothetical protein [Liquorilactobacillus hordei]|uniref:hypothetical protein n=1 Tax=Liquorilactobacillus hordei TaxID=468911 RepID=UPI0039E8F7B2